MKNYYEILEVPVSASPIEIQKAYQELSKKYHPENNGGVTFFNDVYNQVQDAYQVLSNDALRSEYDKLNNLRKSESEPGNNSYNPNLNGSDSKRETKPEDKKPAVYKVLMYSILAISVIAAGYFAYNSLPLNKPDLNKEKEDLVFNAENSNEENIRNLLEIESDRDYSVISTYYAENIVKYWNSENINNEELKVQYTNAWNKSLDSKNNILNVERVDNNTLHVTTEFSFTDSRTNKSNISISLNKYVFNNYGLITQVYNINPVKEYDEYRDSDFSFITNEEKIRRLLKAEDSRNFNKIASFYSPEIDRYWTVENINLADLKKQYDRAWRNTYSSYNIVININDTGYNTYRLTTRFLFATSENPDQVIISDNIIVFNNEGLITQVYGADTF